MTLSRGYVRWLNKKLRYSWSTNKTRPLTCPTILSPQDIQSKSCALGGRVSAQYCSNGKTYLLAWISQRWNNTEGLSPPTPIRGPDRALADFDGVAHDTRPHFLPDLTIVLGTNEQVHNAHLAVANPDKRRSSPTPQIAELLPGNRIWVLDAEFGGARRLHFNEQAVIRPCARHR